MANPIELFGAAGAGGALTTTDNGGQVSGVASEDVNNINSKQQKTSIGGETVSSVLGGGPYVDLRIKINPGDHNIIVKADMGNDVRAFKVLIATKQEEVASLKDINMSVERQRLFLAGKELKDHVVSELK